MSTNGCHAIVLPACVGKLGDRTKVTLGGGGHEIMHANVATALLLISLTSCSGSSLQGNWGVGNGDTLTLSGDKTFVMRTGPEVLHGTYAETTKSHFVLLPAGLPTGVPGCFTSDSVKVQYDSALRIYNRENSDGSLQPRVSASSTTINGQTISDALDCVP